MQIILASSSPRRSALLRQMGLRFEVESVEVDESFAPDMPVAAVVELLARRKAEPIARKYPQGLVIAADTVVFRDAQILGKPRDAQEAYAMLQSISSAVNEVYSGVCVAYRGQVYCDSYCTRVYFDPVPHSAIQAYIQSGEPMDKAGGYGIQGFLGAYARRVEGCYFNVMGLPLAGLRSLMDAALAVTGQSSADFMDCRK